MAVKKAVTEWTGDFRNGRGTITAGGGAFSVVEDFASAFGDGPGTSSVELLMAAISSCFSAALAGTLAKAKFEPRLIRTEARGGLEKTDGGLILPRIEMHCRAEVAGIDEETFQRLVAQAHKACPVGKALAATPIDLKAELIRS